MKYDNTWTAAVVLAGGIGCGKHPREVSIREVWNGKECGGAGFSECFQIRVE